MAVLLNDTNYLQNASNEDWGNAGAIFMRVTPAWDQDDGVDHHLLIKSMFSAASSAFFCDKWTDGHLYIGWITSAVNYRLDVATPGLFTNGVTANHIFHWDTALPARQYWHEGNMVQQDGDAFATPTGLNYFTLGRLFDATASGGANASFAEFGRWNRTLDLREIRLLQETGCPLNVPNGLRQYHPLINPSIVGADLMGRAPLTVVGSPTSTAHPRVFYPATGWIVPLAPVIPDTLLPPVISNAFQVFAPAVGAGAALAPPVISNPFTLFAPSVTSDLGLAPPLLAVPLTIYAPAVHVQESTIQEDSQELEPHNFKVRITDFVAGDDLRISRLYTELAGGITITKAYLTIKRRAVDDADAEAVLQKEITASMQMSGEIVDNDTTGGSIQLYFDLSHTETALLTPLIPFHYDVQVITVGSAVYTCEKGVIVMQQGVTEATS